MTTEQEPMPKTERKPRHQAARRRRAGSADRFIGARIRAARLLAGLSEEELADEMGVSAETVQQYESGRLRLSASYLLGIAGLLGQPISFFFRNFGARKSSAARRGSGGGAGDGGAVAGGPSA